MNINNISYFPRGLVQPHNSFKFSIDALLLASFIAAEAPQKSLHFLDIGTGCGVVAFAALLSRPLFSAVGLDMSAALLDAANQNCFALGLQDKFSSIKANVKDIKSVCKPESFDFVSCNPPYRRSGQGRMPQSPLRLAALFETEGSLESFIEAAAWSLKNKGNFYCVYTAERLVELILCLEKYRLSPKLLLPVTSSKNKNCNLVLLKATKNAAHGIKISPPLVLYETLPTPKTCTKQPDPSIENSIEQEAKSAPALTAEALKFCPFLACNAGSAE